MSVEKIAIYCDFDGTVTTRDTVDFLLERLADPSWQEIEALWERGEIGSRECMARQIPLLQGGWPAIERVLADVQIDPTFPKFVQWCKQHAIPLALVSEGLDRVIYTILAREGLDIPVVWANQLNNTPDGKLSLSFPNAPTDARCKSGLCKCRIINKPLLTSDPDIHRVVIGDGLSDRCWAEEADTLFAKSKLLRYCQENRIACTPFETFETIQTMLESQLHVTHLHPGSSHKPVTPVTSPVGHQSEVLPLASPKKAAASC